VSPLLPALVSAEDLAPRLDEPRIRVFDATVFLDRPPEGGRYAVRSGRAEYVAEHVPGASFADIPGELSDPEATLPFTVLAPDRLAAALGQLGVGDSSHVVVYAQAEPMWATRLWWLLRYVGFDAVSVLDGGLPAWRATGLPVESGTVSYLPAELTARPRPDLLVSHADDVTALGGVVCLVNALAPPVFRGEGETSYSRAGRIPGSSNLPWARLVDRETWLFRSAADRGAALAELGVADDVRVVAYCGGGISATVDVFAWFLDGREDVALYDGSLAEWSADPERPMELG
jgi:thiosulfate/3-mercaptopyruvate sulfurtransferase